MSKSIISAGGRVFQGFVCQLTSALIEPSVRSLVSDNLVLTHAAAKVRHVQTKTTTSLFTRDRTVHL